jgi:hypothetical protein
MVRKREGRRWRRQSGAEGLVRKTVEQKHIPKEEQK